jgi:hypothetical protein
MTTAPSGSEISCGAMLSTVVQVAHGVRTDRHPMLGISPIGGGSRRQSSVVVGRDDPYIALGSAV